MYWPVVSVLASFLLFKWFSASTLFTGKTIGNLKAKKIITHTLLCLVQLEAMYQGGQTILLLWRKSQAPACHCMRQ